MYSTCCKPREESKIQLTQVLGRGLGDGRNSATPRHAAQRGRKKGRAHVGVVLYVKGHQTLKTRWTAIERASKTRRGWAVQTKTKKKKKIKIKKNGGEKWFETEATQLWSKGMIFSGSSRLRVL